MKALLSSKTNYVTFAASEGRRINFDLITHIKAMGTMITEVGPGHIWVKAKTGEREEEIPEMIAGFTKPKETGSWHGVL